MPLDVYYSPAYAPDDSPLLTRLAVSARVIGESGLPLRFHQADPLDWALLEGLHSPDYLKAFREGIEPLASTQGIPWAPRVRDAALAMLGGQIAAARCALRTGMALNLARGFHHAIPERGMGFCPLNGLALVAHCFPEQQVFVLDCDEHGGNGTESFTARLPNLSQASIFGTRFGCYGAPRSWDFQIAENAGFAAYRDALGQARELIQRQAPDLLIYQAGADCHRDDPKGRSGLNTEELLERDRFVFRSAQELGLPVLFVLAGGYQSAEAVAELNLNTVRAACAVLPG